MDYIHRGFNHPNGGVSPVKHAGHYPGNKADHTIADHAKQGVEKVKKTYTKAKEKAVDVVKEGASTAADKVKKGAKKAWDQAGYAYQAYKATPGGKRNIQTVSDVLAVASVPANLIAEAVEGVGGKGDKEFNFSDAMPDLSSDRGSFNFKNMHGKNTKTVSSVAEIKNPYLAFAVDLATDPTTYLGVGLIKNVVKKGIKKSTKALVKGADDITKSNKKQIIKAIDEGPVGPKTKGGVDGGGDVHFKSMAERTVPNRGGKLFDDPMSEYNSMKSMYNQFPDHVVKPLDPVFDKAGKLTGYNMEKVKGVDMMRWMDEGNTLTKEMYDDIATTITDMNKKGIYHGDLKINNIMIDATGNWKLIDPVGFKHASNMTDEMLKVAQYEDGKALESLSKLVK